jgi:hypothetical protein
MTAYLGWSDASLAKDAVAFTFMILYFNPGNK